MTAPSRHARLFTLRIWQEAAGDDQVEWRGKVQALPEGEAYYFRGYSGLIERLATMLAPAAPAPPVGMKEGFMLAQSTVEKTREVMTKYFDSHHSDVSMMAEDVVFTNMATGQESHGRDGVMGMLNYFYRVAFDADATTRTTLFGENNAMVEGLFVGKHIGEFAGIPATGKDVSVPICVVYDLENNLIKRGRVYFEVPALLQQLGVNPG